MDESDQQRALRLEAQLAAVAARVFQLEQQIAMLRGSPPPAPPYPQPTPAVPPRQPRAEAMRQNVATAVADRRSLESRVGSQWFNRIGIVAVLIGVAWFLKFAFENHWIGAAGRVLTGLLCGAALVAWSERFRARGYTTFSYSLKALGSGVLYLSLWAAFSVYQLIGSGVGFAGMITVTAFNAFIAWRQNAELLAVYAIVGAFSTPLLLSTGHNDEVFLFTYLLIMNAATLTLLVLKGWNRLLVLSFLGTVAFYWGWYWTYYAPAFQATTTAFLLLFFLLFAAATLLARRSRGTQDDGARLLVSMGNAAFGFLGIHAMLTFQYHPQTTVLAWCAVAFAAFYLAMYRFTDRAGSPAVSLADMQLSIAIIFLTLAIPLAVHGHWVTIGFLAEHVVLLWLATRTPSLLMRALAVGALLLGLCSLAVDASAVQTQVLWNTRFLSFAVAIAVTTLSASIARQARQRDPQQDTAPLPWLALAIAGPLLAHLLALITGLLEIHTYWNTRPAFIGGHTLTYRELADRAMAAQFTDSAWLLLVGAVVLAAGFQRRSALLRWQGLAVLTVTIGKVFLVDTSTLTQGYRIVSFLVLGALLLGVSFVYQKDWLHLRAGSGGHTA